MKKIAGIFLIAVFALTGLNSCKECYSCDFGKEGVKEFCSNDFPDKTSGLRLTIDAYEDRGYKCTKK